MTFNRIPPLPAVGLLLVLALWSASGIARQLLMARSMQPFPEAMLTLQSAISDHGYTVARVQRVDIGLTSSGFKTDKYRVVFFGKPEEIHRLTATYPQLIPYLPLKMTIFAERDNTLVVAADPLMLMKLVPDADQHYLFERWKNDIQSILDDLRSAE